jgi:hypothetical protein
LRGSEEAVRQRFGGRVLRFHATRLSIPFEYPFPPKAVLQFFRKNYGLMARAFDSLEVPERAALWKELLVLFTACNLCSCGYTRFESEYLEVIAISG